MAQHIADNFSTNPRLQCVVCGRWKRVYTRDARPPHDLRQTFFGGCEYSNGGDHLAGKPGDNDVCEDCCHVACKTIAYAKAHKTEQQA